MELAFMHEFHYGQDAIVLRADNDLKSNFSIYAAGSRQPGLVASLLRRRT